MEISANAFRTLVKSGKVTVSKGRYTTNSKLVGTKKGKHRVRESKSRKKAVKDGFKSAFEQTIAKKLDYYNIPFEYEPYTMDYFLTPNVKCTCLDCGSSNVLEAHTYSPDFVLRDDLIIETKGLFSAKDRKKMIAVKKYNPDVKIVMLFQSPNNKITKKSKTTYEKWAVKNGFIVIHTKNIIALKNY